MTGIRRADFGAVKALALAKQYATTAGEYVSQAAAHVTAALAARTGAEAARDEAQALVLSDLGTTDGQTRALIENPNSQTAAALSASIADFWTPVDNGDGTLTLPTGLAVDNGDGTVTIGA